MKFSIKPTAEDKAGNATSKQTQTGFSILVIVILLSTTFSLFILFFIFSKKIEVQNKTPLQTNQLASPTAKPFLIPDKPGNTPQVSPGINIDPVTGWQIYYSKKYGYTLSFPSEWQLKETVVKWSIDDINISLSNANRTAGISLDAVPAGQGCAFMQGPNPRLIPRPFKIGSKSVTLKDDCFEKEYSVELKNKTGVKITLFIITKDNENYKIVYKILESIQGLELAE